MRKCAMKQFDIPTPSEKEVDYWLAYWDSLPNYTEQEKALDKLFLETFKENEDISEILIKCSTLNDFYSTNIFKIYDVAKHIEALHIDKMLNAGDESLVEKIANIDLKNNKGEIKHHCFYSFASKYCSHHRPYDYPIYDSYVEKILKYFKKINRDFNFNNDDLKDYAKFKKILLEFQRLYGIEKYNLKDLDRYLWQLGKKHFPNNYGK